MLKVVSLSEDVHYLPESLRNTNEYKATVQITAKPTFPVIYLVGMLSHGFPSSATGDSGDRSPSSICIFGSHESFTVCNRADMAFDDKPNISAVSLYLKNNRYSLNSFSNFNLLLYLSKSKIFPSEFLDLLLQAVRERSGIALDCIH